MDVLLVSLTDIPDEMRTLVRTAGHHIVREVIQRKPEAPKTFVGRGKLEELTDLVRDLGVGAVVVNGDVRPPQLYRLEQALGVECFDRTRIILEVFIQQAHTREAKMQVELAMLQYEVPILREWVHRALSGERPGFMAGGEYRVDSYFETVKRKIRKVKADLDKIREDRARRRSRRQDRGFHLIGIGGYANAGKSSLLNALTGAHVLVEDRMFSTLSTTTRSLSEGRPKVLLTDTVGFIDAVPLWLIEAFHATLEELYDADLVLLLLDGSDSEAEFERKLRLAVKTLLARVDPPDILPVISKADRMSGEDRMRRAFVIESSELRKPLVTVSTRTGEGMDELRATLAERFRLPITLRVQVALDAVGPGTVSWLHEIGEVDSVAYADGVATVRLRCDGEDVERIRRRVAVAEVVVGLT